MAEYWKLTTAIRGFTAGKSYKQFSENSFNVALKNDNGCIEYVAKKFLIEVYND